MYQSGSPWTDHTLHPKFWYLHMLLNTKFINQQGQCFFCKFEGTESVDGFSVTENNGLLFSASERSSRDDGLFAATENFDDQESQSHAINHQTKEISNDGSFSHLGFLPSEKSSEKHKTNKSCSDITVTFDDEQTVEIDRELTEFDVERVLEKQNTHDLYCPNCNSCITGRVILRKRKRSIWIPDEDKKRNEGQPLGASQLDASIAPAQNYQGHNTVDNSLDGSLIPEANGHHLGQEPEVFRCFSCFSFFIPPGSGFKLFKKLGDKSEKENIQSPRPISEVKKNWFSFLFSSHAETVLVAQGSDHMADVGKSSVEASEKVTERGSARILIQQKAMEHILKPVKNATFEHNQDGLNILVHSSTDSLTVEKSDMDEKLNAAIKPADGTDSILLLSKPASVLGESDISENVYILADLSENGQNVDASPSTKPLVEYQNTEVKISRNGSGHMAGVEKSSVEASEKVTERDTGSGFKLFKKLWDKSEKENLQSPSFLFSSPAETVLVAQAGILLQQKALEHILNPVKNATFEHNQDGLKILVQSIMDSLTFEKFHMDEKLNVAIKSKPPGSWFKLFKKLWDKSEKENQQSPSFLFSSPAETVLVAQAGILLQQKALEHILKHVKNATFEHNQDGLKILVQSIMDSLTVEKSHMDEKLNVAIKSKPPGTDAIIDVQERPVEQKERKRDVEKGVVGTIIPPAPPKTPFPHGGFNGMDIIRSIVYGGLVESITSLGVVLSAAGADATTLNILALGLANLIGGLFMIGQNLWELKNDRSGSISTETAEDASDQTSKQLDRYQELLRQRGKFSLHATFAILSHLIFGSLPPVIYGFSFRESDNRYFKLFAVAASSLLCIILLAAGKAYTQRPPRSFIKTVIYYMVAGFMARPGVSYSVGDQIKKFLEKLGWLSSDSALTLTIPLQQQAWGGAYQDR